jgi:hypothetical protein
MTEGGNLSSRGQLLISAKKEHRLLEVEREFLEKLIKQHRIHYVGVCDGCTKFSIPEEIEGDETVYFQDNEIAAYRTGLLSLSELLGDAVDWDKHEMEVVNVLISMPNKAQTLYEALDKMRIENWNVKIFVLQPINETTESSHIWSVTSFHPLVKSKQWKYVSESYILPDGFKMRTYRPGGSGGEGWTPEGEEAGRPAFTGYRCSRIPGRPPYVGKSQHTRKRYMDMEGTHPQRQRQTAHDPDGTGA